MFGPTNEVCGCVTENKGCIYRHSNWPTRSFCKHNTSLILIDDKSVLPIDHQIIHLCDHWFRYEISIKTNFWNDVLELDKTSLYLYLIASPNGKFNSTMMDSFAVKNVRSILHPIY